MSRRKGHSVRAAASFGVVSVVVLVLGGAEAILRHPAAQVVVVVVVPLITFALGCWSRQAGLSRQRVPAEHDQDELARLRAVNAKLRVKVRSLSDEINGPEIRS